MTNDGFYEDSFVKPFLIAASMGFMGLAPLRTAWKRHAVLGGLSRPPAGLGLD